jgi:hypothetical protein
VDVQTERASSPACIVELREHGRGRIATTQLLHDELRAIGLAELAQRGDLGSDALTEQAVIVVVDRVEQLERVLGIAGDQRRTSESHLLGERGRIGTGSRGGGLHDHWRFDVWTRIELAQLCDGVGG